MSDIKPFPELTELQRRLIVNALKIWRGEFGPIKLDGKSMWQDDINALLKHLGADDIWGNGSDACEHGVGPKGGDRCYECWLNALRKTIETLNDKIDWQNRRIASDNASLLTTQSERDQARKELEEAQKQMGIWRELYKSCGQYRDENKCAEADAAEQQVRSLQKAARDVLDEHRCLGEQTSLHVSQCPRCRLAALSQRRES